MKLTFSFSIFKDQLGYKSMIVKLSGFAKFDLDTKVTKLQFFHLLEEMSQEEIALEKAGSAE